MPRYTQVELDEAALADLESDMRGALRQAIEGPFYPSNGITAESLRAYAEKCRRQIERAKAGESAHRIALQG